MKKVLETKNQVQLSVNKEFQQGEYEYIVMKKDVHKKIFQSNQEGSW